MIVPPRCDSGAEREAGTAPTQRDRHLHRITPQRSPRSPSAQGSEAEARSVLEAMKRATRKRAQGLVARQVGQVQVEKDEVVVGIPGELDRSLRRGRAQADGCRRRSAASRATLCDSGPATGILSQQRCASAVVPAAGTAKQKVNAQVFFDQVTSKPAITSSALCWSGASSTRAKASRKRASGRAAASVRGQQASHHPL